MALLHTPKGSPRWPEGDPLLVQLASLVGPDAAPRTSDSAAPAESAEFPGLSARYELRQLVGQGSMGQVYEAFDRLLGRRVAVKILARRGPVSIGLMRREREVLAALEHPGVVAIYDSGELADGSPYYVMRFVEGRNLRDYARDRRLGVNDIVELMLRVARAVGVAHLVRIVHRDLKPQNILVTDSGQPVILDFGLAKFTGATEESGEPAIGDDVYQTVAHGLVRGTPAYMSPEQAAAEPVDARSDTYSLGVILCELLSGELPAPRSLDSIRPRRLASIIRKSLDPFPEHRYQSATELADDLQAFLADRPVRAVCRHRHRHVAAQFLRRNKRRLAVASLALAFCAATLALAFDQVRRERDVAVANARIAREQRDAAEQNRAWAMDEKSRADVREAEARRHLYAGDLARSLQALDARDYSQARKILDQFVPVAGKPDQRTFEWFWLDRLSSEGPTVLRGSAYPLTALAIASRTGLVAGGDERGAVHLWRLADHSIVRDFKHAGRHIVALAFSADEQTLVSVDRWATALAWNLADGSLRSTARHVALGRASSLAVSNDGKRFAVGNKNGDVLLWDAATGRLLAKNLHLAANEVISLDFSHDASRLAMGAKDNRGRVLELPSLHRIAEFPPLPTPIRAILFRDGSRDRLIAHTMHGGVAEYDVPSQAVRPICELSIGIVAASRSPSEGDVLTTVHENGEVCRRLRDGTVRRSRVLSGNASAVAVSPDGDWVAASAERDTSIVLDRPQSDHGFRRISLEGNSGRLAMDPANGLVCVTFASGCEVVDPATLVRRAGISRATADISSVAVDPVHRLAITGDVSGRLSVWNRDTGNVTTTIQTGLQHIASLACDPSAQLVFVGGGFGPLECWDYAAGRLLWKQPAHKYLLSDLKVDPNGRFVVSASWDGSLKVWDASNGSPLRTVGGQLGLIDRAAIDPAGRWVASTCRDGRVRRWALDTGELIDTLEQDGLPALAVAVSPDRLTLAAVFGSGTLARLVFHHLQTSRKTLVLDIPYSGVTDLAFAADGRQLFAVAHGPDGKSYLVAWDGRPTDRSLAATTKTR